MKHRICHCENCEETRKVIKKAEDFAVALSIQMILTSIFLDVFKEDKKEKEDEKGIRP